VFVAYNFKKTTFFFVQSLFFALVTFLWNRSLEQCIYICAAKDIHAVSKSEGPAEVRFALSQGTQCSLATAKINLAFLFGQFVISDGRVIKEQVWQWI